MEWKFKVGAEQQGTSAGFWYDITDGGYIKPDDVLLDKVAVARVQEAVEILKSFEEALEENGLLNGF